MYDRNRWVTVAHLSDTYGYSREYLRRLIRQGKIKADKVGSVWLVDAMSFSAYYVQVLEKPQGGPRG
uniref:Putative DNA binding, helix-turn-helix domain containing protein n=1 Tax=viral metagenome TaxID=1070528 RepID=A0A6M3LSQ3_9ZZZZ